MKKTNTIIEGLLVFGLCVGLSVPTAHAEKKTEKLQGTITLSGAWALYPMAVKWAEEFQKVYPKIKIDVAAGGAGKGMADCLAQIVDIGMVSRDIYPEEVAKGAWWVSVTRDAVVPTINENNPVAKDLLERGVTKEMFVKIWIDGSVPNWGGVIGSQESAPLHVYTRSDACGAAETWAKYLGKKQEDLLGVGVYGDPGLAEAVKKDEEGIGYNNINYIYDAKTRMCVPGIRALPIDINGDGRIDGDEDFYSTSDMIVNAIATGRYPSPPSRALFFVSRGRPTKEIVVLFITWVLTEGQKYVPESGYINLPQEQLAQELAKL